MSMLDGLRDLLDDLQGLTRRIRLFTQCAGTLNQLKDDVVRFSMSVAVAVRNYIWMLDAFQGVSFSLPSLAVSRV